jgi:hypothetical protein
VFVGASARECSLALGIFKSFKVNFCATVVYGICIFKERSDHGLIEYFETASGDISTYSPEKSNTF